MKLVASMIFFLMSSSAFAVTIEFPEEELARESVLPVFDNTYAVKSRLVPTKERFELGLNMGFAMNEPFFESLRYGGHIGYHFNETHAVVVSGQLYQQGLGGNGTALAGTDLDDDGGPGNPDVRQLFVRMEYAPQSKYHLFLNYQVTPYYGKISVFKDFVMNLSLYGMIGIGGVDIGGEFSPGLNLGLGQKFYFSKNWGIRTDLNMVGFRGINYFGANGGGPSPLQDASDSTSDDVTSAVPVSAFEKQMNYDMQLSVSLIILI